MRKVWVAAVAVLAASAALALAQQAPGNFWIPAAVNVRVVSVPPQPDGKTDPVSRVDPRVSLAMIWPRSLLMLTLVMGQTAELPPPFPRPGTTQVFENDVVAVWNVSWLKQQYPLHTHRYDLIGISYEEGDRIITQGNAPGRLVNTKAWEFQTNRANVTHVEEGASDPPLRAILIELKRASPTGGAGGGPEDLRRVIGAPSWENNRAAGWMLMSGVSAPTHRHTGDAVELVFDGKVPKATFLPAGTLHAGPAAPSNGRVVIFEIK